MSGAFWIGITIWLSLVCYLAACLGFLGYFRSGTRTLWTLAWFFFILHFLAAYHFFHHWSHAHALAHTEAESGFGPGIYISYFFVIVWTADVAWWWLLPNLHARRPRWPSYGLHAFMLFILFNGAVVFETGLARWAGLILFVALGLALAFAITRKKQVSPIN